MGSIQTSGLNFGRQCAISRARCALPRSKRTSAMKMCFWVVSPVRTTGAISRLMPTPLQAPHYINQAAPKSVVSPRRTPGPGKSNGACWPLLTKWCVKEPQGQGGQMQLAAQAQQAWRQGPVGSATQSTCFCKAVTPQGGRANSSGARSVTIAVVRPLACWSTPGRLASVQAHPLRCAWSWMGKFL